MCKVVSIIPPQNEGEHTRTQGTKVLLDNGEYLRGVRSIRLECDPDSFWKAFIEVAPTNQKQIDALIAGVEVNKPLTNDDQVKSIDEQIKELEFKRDVLNGKLPLGSDGITFASGGYIQPTLVRLNGEQVDIDSITVEQANSLSLYSKCILVANGWYQDSKGGMWPPSAEQKDRGSINGQPLELPTKGRSNDKATDS